MQLTNFISLLSLIVAVTAYPFMANYDKMSEVEKRVFTVTYRRMAKRSADEISSKYPYTGDKNDGLPGTQIGNVLVPAVGDTDHQYQDPPAGAFRGPCPGLNAAANHGFLSRDGIVTFNELVQAQQNVYNVGYDLAVVLATLGVGLDGDLVTLKLSIGGDATSQTSALGGSREGGLETHNKFEADASLTRSDYYLNNGDNYSFNGTLFNHMATTCNKVFDRECMTKYRAMRYAESKAENGQFIFLPTALLLYGASSFLYELMPTNGGGPDFATISTFFGAKDNGDGTYSHVPERIPDNWFNRASPYTLVDVNNEINAQYLASPVLFGFNVGYQNFLGLNTTTGIVNGKFSPNTANDVACVIQQAVLAAVPSTVQGFITSSVSALTGIAAKINPIFAQTFGCPAVTAGVPLIRK